jgi:hypothetical protein
MPLPEKRDHRISLAEASDLTKRHRKEHPKDDHGGFFHREAFEALLKQSGCAGIRIYRGKAEKGTHHFVMVGVNQEGNDMIEGGVMERCWPCPPYCDTKSALVSG